jgi:uncharacterized protein
MCLTSRSPYHFIYQSLVTGKFDIVVSVDIMLEYEEIIQNKYSTATEQTFITLLTELTNVHCIQSYYQWRLIETDADDNKYCDCAIGGQAEYIVTEDKHFDSLKNIPFPSLSVITIDHFLGLLLLQQQ